MWHIDIIDSPCISLVSHILRIASQDLRIHRVNTFVGASMMSSGCGPCTTGCPDMCIGTNPWPTTQQWLKKSPLKTGSAGLRTNRQLISKHQRFENHLNMSQSSVGSLLVWNCCYCHHLSPNSLATMTQAASQWLMSRGNTTRTRKLDDPMVPNNSSALEPWDSSRKRSFNWTCCI